MAGAEFDDTTPDSVDEGDGGALRMSARRELYSQIRDAAGNERGANVNASNAVLVAQTGELPAGTQNIGDVDVASIAAGDNNIGNVDVLTLPALPAGSNNIGDVDVLSIVPGTGATNLGKAIDSAAGATDTGIAPLAMRDDALAALTPIEGDYVPLRTDANGALWVHDDALDAALAGSELQVDVVGALPAGANNIGDVDVLTVPAPLSTTGGGTEAAALRVTVANDSTGVLSVDDNGASITVDNAALSVVGGGVEATALRVTIASDSTGVLSVDDNGGALTVDGTVTANLAAGTNTNEVVGDVAHDAAAAGNPLMVAGVAETPDDSAPANQVSAEADAVRIVADRDGAIYTHPHPPRIWSTSNEYTTQQTDTSIKAAPGAGLSLYITDIVIVCNAAVTVTIEEGTTVTKFKYYGSGQGDGVAHAFVTPIKVTANTAVTVTTSAAVTVFVAVNGYTAP